MLWSELVNRVLREGGFKPSRVGPLRSSAQKYLQMLGVDPDKSHEHVYLKPDAALKAMIELEGKDLSQRTRYNLLSAVRAILRIGMARGWIEPPKDALVSWRDRPSGDDARLALRKRGKPSTYRLGSRGDPIPAAFADELQRYVHWCTAEYMPKRSRRVKKRQISAKIHRDTALRIAGYAVYELGVPADTLSLDVLTDPELLESYVAWVVQRLGRLTRTVDDYLGPMFVIARHWVKDEPRAETILKMLKELPVSAPVRDKAARWLSLKELERVAESCYPLNARRVQENPKARRIWRHLQDRSNPPYRDSNQKRTAYWAGLSILLKIWIRCPVRQRCWREAELGRHVEKQPDGGWLFRWVGSDLKVGARKGVPNEYVYHLDPELRPRFEEWVNHWRPMLAGPDEQHLWLNSKGGPWTIGMLRDQIMQITYRFSGKGVNPHLIRDIFASEMLAHGASIHDVARALGDKMETVFERYARILEKDAEVRTRAQLNTLLS